MQLLQGHQPGNPKQKFLPISFVKEVGVVVQIED